MTGKSTVVSLYFEAEVETLSPLHIGTGEVTIRDSIKNDKGELVAIAALCRDCNGEPYIPPTGLKGILKRQLIGVADETIEALFGTISHSDNETGHMGAFIIYGAEFISTDTQSALPKIENGIFISARTKIDPATGTADDGKLFYQEMCVPGTKFKLRARLTDPSLKPHVQKLFAALAQTTGVAAGKGQADGQGRLQLVANTVKVTTETINNDGRLERDIKPLELSKFIPANIFKLKLTCDGPFMVGDWSSKTTQKDRNEDNREQDPYKAQRHKETSLPELPGSSLMGALRARATWINHPEIGGDEEVVKRLFGQTGSAAILHLDHIECIGNPKTFTLTTVKIDRFSGAPIDSALATVEAFVNPIFEASFSMAPGRFDDTDETARQQLFADLEANGLMLGHSTNTGFGWFEVEEIS